MDSKALFMNVNLSTWVGLCRTRTHMLLSSAAF